jgi:phage gp29-like protein
MITPDAPRDMIAEENQTGMHGPSPVLGPDGQDARRYLALKERETLKEEIARPELIGVRAFWDQSIASGLTPERMGTILRNAIRGDHRYFLQLAEEMEERDGHYGSVLSTRKRAISALRAVVEPSSEKRVDKKIADAVRDLLGEPQFRDMLRDLTDAFGKGYSAIEIVWGERDGLWRPAAYKWRDPKYFTFDFVSRSELRLAVLGTIDGVALPPAKFIVHMPKLKSGIPIRCGFARLAAWSWMFKTYTLKDWMAFLDVFGMPIRVGKYHPAATAEDRRKLLTAVSQIAVDAAAIIPESMAIEFIEAKGFADKPFENMARFMDEQLSKVVLGQTMSTDGHAGGLAQAKIHNLVRIDIKEDDADQLAATINRDLVAPFCALNFGADVPRPYAIFPVAEPEDVAALTNSLAALVPLGLKVSMREAREKIGFGEPDGDEELLAAPQGKPAGQKPLNPAQLDRAWNGARPLALNAEDGGSAVALEEVEEIAATGAEDWAPQLSPIVAKVLAAAREAKSYEEFVAALDRLAGEIDADPLAKRLAAAGLKARALGDLGLGKA